MTRVRVKTLRQWTEPTINLKEGETAKTHEVDSVDIIDTEVVFDYQDLLDQGVIEVVAPELNYVGDTSTNVEGKAFEAKTSRRKLEAPETEAVADESE